MNPYVEHLRGKVTRAQHRLWRWDWVVTNEKTGETVARGEEFEFHHAVGICHETTRTAQLALFYGIGKKALK